MEAYVTRFLAAIDASPTSQRNHIVPEINLQVCVDSVQQPGQSYLDSFMVFARPF